MMKKLFFRGPVLLFLAFNLYCSSGLLKPSAKKTENLGIFADSRKKDVLGQDGVTPVPISDKVTMWTFGDTILGTWKESVSTDATFSDRVSADNMISNSLAFTDRPTSGNVSSL